MSPIPPIRAFSDRACAYRHFFMLVLGGVGSPVGLVRARRGRARAAPPRRRGVPVRRDPWQRTDHERGDDAASAQQASAGGGPGYEGLEVHFAFTPATPITSPDAKAWAERTQTLQLTNSWYPGPRYVEKYGLTEGKTIPAVLEMITKGTCTPFVFALSGIDPSDYFETAK